MMNALRSKGTLVVTNHDEPEAVIIPMAEYGAIMQLVEQAEAQTESARSQDSGEPSMSVSRCSRGGRLQLACSRRCAVVPNWVAK